MIAVQIRTINDEIADFLACQPSDSEVLACYMPPDFQARLNMLLDWNGEGELTYEEEVELDGILRANGFVSLLKAKVKRRQRLGKL